MANIHPAAEPSKVRHKHEGPQKHIIAFILSAFLTAIAFAVVVADMNTSFKYFLLVMMAFLQVFVQMAFWMHMKDKGHRYAIIGIISGIIVVITMVLMAEFITWW